MLTTKNAFLIVLITYIFYSCASIGSPEGGLKDEIGPVLVVSNPINRALQVNNKTLLLEFDEEIRIKDINRQLLITPNVNNPFTAITKKNKVEIAFEKPLQTNTTYFLNFRAVFAYGCCVVGSI